MRITEKRLKEIIKEELSKIKKEGFWDDIQDKFKKKWADIDDKRGDLEWKKKLVPPAPNRSIRATPAQTSVKKQADTGGEMKILPKDIAEHPSFKRSVETVKRGVADWVKSGRPE